MNQNTLKAYFGFLTEPFSKEIATKSLFLSAQLKGLFERLQHFIGRRGDCARHRRSRLGQIHRLARLYRHLG